MTITDAYWEKANDYGQITIYEKDGFSRTMSVGAGQWAFVIKANVTNKRKKAINLFDSFYGEATINDKYEYGAALT